MKDSVQFRQFLENDFRGAKTGRPLGAKTARDVVCRCRRVERSLGIDLSKILTGDQESIDSLQKKIKKKAGLLGYRGDLPYFYTLFTLNVRYYNQFLSSQRSRGTASSGEKSRST